LESNCNKYGRLYEWSVALVVCPSSWHLPNNADWDKLLRYVDGNTGTSSPYNSPTAGKYLKATSGWENCGPYGSGISYLCEDTHGFSAFPSGLRRWDGSFYGDGIGGTWWSASQNVDGVYSLRMGFSHERAEFYISGGDLYSIRCIKD
jgi:uncharacterized protein (TIGR02145 family)